MAIERLKFRCYRCNQLLGATPNKAGAVVTCPKCSAELLIPTPEIESENSTRGPAPPAAKVRSGGRPKVETESTSTATAVGSEPGVLQGPIPGDDFAAALPPDLIDLRPEDLRVEAEFFESLTRQSQQPVAAEPAPWAAAQAIAPSFASQNYPAPRPCRPLPSPRAQPHLRCYPRTCRRRSTS